MARIDLYLSDDEKQWVGTQKRGFVRGLVRDAMGRGKDMSFRGELAKSLATPEATGRTQVLTPKLDAQPGRPMAISPSQYAKKKEAP